jgi:hypothetical protein
LNGDSSMPYHNISYLKQLRWQTNKKIWSSSYNECLN